MCQWKAFNSKESVHRHTVEPKIEIIAIRCTQYPADEQSAGLPFRHFCYPTHQNVIDTKQAPKWHNGILKESSYSLGVVK